MQGFLGPDRHSASPACTYQALRAPAHTQAAPIPKRKLASCGSWFCLRKQIPSTLYSEICLSHTYNRSQSPRVVPSQAGQSQLFHNFWIFPHSRCLAVSLVLMLFHLAPPCVHSFTHSLNKCCWNACRGPGPVPGPWVEHKQSPRECLPSRSTWSRRGETLNKQKHKHITQRAPSDVKGKNQMPEQGSAELLRANEHFSHARPRQKVRTCIRSLTPRCSSGSSRYSNPAFVQRRKLPHER